MTWDTLDTQPACLGAGLHISGGGLIATSLTSNTTFHQTNHVLAQAIEGKKSGKFCVELECLISSPNDGFAGFDRIGVAGSAAIGLNGGNGYGMLGTSGGAGFADQFGISFNNVGYGGGSYVVIDIDRFYLIGQNDVAAWNVGHWVPGDRLYIAMDLGNGLFWFRINGGPWLGMTNPANPAAGTGGISYRGGLAGWRYYPAASIGPGGSFAFNFGQSAFANPAPTGFTPGWTNTAQLNFGSQLSNGLGGTFGGAAPPTVLVSKYASRVTGQISRLLGTATQQGTTTAVGVIYDTDGPGGVPYTLLASSGVVAGTTEVAYALTHLAVSGHH